MSEARLGVEIDNARIVDAAPLHHGARGTLDLAAIERGQRRALIKLYVVRGNRHTELTSIPVSNLPVFSNRRALLQLRTEVDRTGTLRVRLDVEHRFYTEQRIDVRRYLRRRPAAVLTGVIALLLIAGAGLFFLLWSPTADQATDGGAEPDTETERVSGTEMQSDTGERSRDAEADPADEAATDEVADEPAQAPTDTPADETAEAPGGTAQAPADKPEAPGGTAEAPADEREADRTAGPDIATEPAEWTVYFRPESPELIAETRRALDEAAEQLDRYGDEAEVSIVGHTALRGTEQGRYGLSRERARNVFFYLEDTGWEAEQEVSVEGVGGEQPVTTDEDRQELNRRVEIRVEPKETGR